MLLQDFLSVVQKVDMLVIDDTHVRSTLRDQPDIVSCCLQHLVALLGQLDAEILGSVSLLLLSRVSAVTCREFKRVNAHTSLDGLSFALD